MQSLVTAQSGELRERTGVIQATLDFGSDPLLYRRSYWIAASAVLETLFPFFAR